MSALLAVSLVTAAPPVAHKTENVIFVMTDGFRWQEMFRGADPALLSKAAGVDNVPALQGKYGGANEEERRKKLLPFVWSTFATAGQMYGDRDLQSDATVTNGLNFSYPGYSEALCGFPDSRVRSNDKVPNPNVTVFEWLQNKPRFHGETAAFAAWDAFPYIFNAPRAGFPVNAGYEAFDVPGAPQVSLLNQLKKNQPHLWEDEPFDAVPFYTALEYLKARSPKLLYISLGETDDWAHGNRYDLYLEAAHHADEYLKVLWDVVQGMPAYRDKTTLVFGTDHGRGSGAEWTDHGQKIPDSENVWFAFLGPDTVPLGVRHAIPAVTQSQLAGTIAALVGEDYRAAVPQSGSPLPDVVPLQAEKRGIAP